MEHVPVRDQGNLGVCYAYAAAQVFDAYRMSHGDQNSDFRASAIIAAAEFSREYFKDAADWKGVDGGSFCPSFNQFKKNGACPDQRKTFSGIEMEQLLKKFLSTQRAISTKLTLRQRAQADWAEKVGLPVAPEIQKARQEQRGEASRAVLEVCEDLGPVSFSFASKVQQVLTEDRENELVGLLSDRVCPPQLRRKHSPVPACHGVNRGELADFGQRKFVDTAHFLKLIQRKLKEPNAQPLGIDYCAEVLSRGKDFDCKFVNIPMLSVAADRGNHISLVIGQRPHPKTGRCEFLVRNSWGTGCSVYSSDWQCENGNIWVDAEALLRNTDKISYLE